MKQITITLCIACFFLFSCNDSKTDSTNATNDSTKITTDTSTTMTPPMDSATMMKAWMEYMTPGDIHKMIAKSNGTWDEDVTVWMDPAAPPTKSKSIAVNKMILGGRYQESRHKGSFNGMPFEGISTLGYDNAKKVFQSTWVDNMGTGVMYLEGTWDSTSHTINFKGKGIDPSTGKEMEVREIFTMVDDNNQKMEMFATQSGKENKTMEIVLKRK